MRVPVSWLCDYVPIEMPLADLATRLSISAAEVEGIERRGVPDSDGNLALFRVGKVLEAGKHPNADRLQLCRVDVGEGEPRQIVCGAWNFGAGATVAVALPGAVLPNGLQLERRQVRGELSDGMILAEDEVALGTDHAGIMVLGDVHEPGTPLVDAPPPGRDPEQVGDEPVQVEIEDFAAAPRYIGRLFREVTIGPSPVWLKARLLDAGMRPISNVVDVTNYVMLAVGNPLHAFDFSTLAGGRIVVRRARPGERLRTLDGVERS